MPIITLRVIGMKLRGFVALMYGIDIYRDEYEGIAWDCHEFKVIHINEVEVTPTSLPLVLSGECMLLGSVSSQQRFGVTDFKALEASQLLGLGQTVL